jgi:hypothetical protein
MRNKPIQESTILISGTARNVEKKLPDFICGMNICFSGFKSVHFLIVESFSTDKTVQALRKLKLSHKDFECFTDDTISPGETRRTVRIASARSSVQQWIRNQPIEYDYVVMADMDGVNRDLTKEAVESCWLFDGWDVVAASQPFRYYDLWALRAAGWNEKDCWEEFEELAPKHGIKKAKKIAITSKMRGLARKSEWVEVESAFGGLAIYRTTAFLSGEYLGSDSSGREICEHVPFHREIRSKGFRIFINPALVNISRKRQVAGIFKSQLTSMANLLK